MILKELLMFLLLCQVSKAGNDNNTVSFRDKCVSDGGEILDRWNRICIPGDSLGILTFGPETTTAVEVIVSKLQIIEIGDDKITLSLDIIAGWIENRLKINTQGFPIGRIDLTENDQKQIWSPEISIANNVLSKSKDGERSGLVFGEKALEYSGLSLKDYVPGMFIAWKRFFLTTSVICDMDFQKFPFDKHNCTIEVSYMINLECSLNE